jgi:hypothetical protein
MNTSIHHFRRPSGQHVVMRADVRFRVAVAGAELRMLVLAPRPSGCVGVDLDSGAFVRAMFPGPVDEPLAPLDLVAGEVGDPIDPPDPSQPEAVQLGAVPRRVGRAGSRRVGRWLTPLHHPPQGPLLGFAGSRIPYWTLVGDRPSLALVVPTAAAEVRLGPNGYECIFGWQGATHQYPLVDPFLLDTLRQLERRHMGAHDMARVLGFRPGRILVILSEPHDGYCWKEVAALLPGS